MAKDNHIVFLYKGNTRMIRHFRVVCVQSILKSQDITQ